MMGVRTELGRSVWLLPTLAFGAALLIGFGGLNRTLFLAINGDQSDTFWSSMTILGDTGMALSLFLLFCGRESRLVAALFVSIIPGTLLVHGLKALADVARPAAVLAAEQIQVIGPHLSHHAFPSGHSATAFIAAGLLLLHFRRAGWFFEGLAVAGLIAGSRVIVGAHWPVDVLVGAGIGWMVAAFSLHVAERWPAAEGLSAQRIMALLLFTTALYSLLFLDTRYPEAIWFQRVFIAAVILLSIPGLVRLFSAVGRPTAPSGAPDE